MKQRLCTVLDTYLAWLMRFTITSHHRIRQHPDLPNASRHRVLCVSETYDLKARGDQLGAQCSATERCADEATRDVTVRLKCYHT
jgi:exoribonuclease R